MPFTIFDTNMNEIDYPVGVLPLDFLVSAIEKERYIETVNGIPGNVNYGFDYKEREVTLNFWLRHYHGEHDQKLLKSELYAMLDSQHYFYVSDERLPTRVLKLAIDEPYLPDRINGSNISTLEVKCQIIGLPFWRTKYTTQDIEREGYEALAEEFGMADGINQDMANYRFQSSVFSVWNGGNVTIDPRQMHLDIRIWHSTSKGNATIENLTTGDKVIIYRKHTDSFINLIGSKVMLADTNWLRESNRQYITLAPGENKIRISNTNFSDVTFDFPFYFK
ncbi:phage tail domain-containing protein [Staphylococcus hominis]|uniref:phage tail domain-containing protein n=1 Tax=Staphylococcus hominis TaxID=1290 RepID=UPI0030169FB7